MDGDSFLISISDIFDYVGDSKRCLKEGEEVLRSNHLILCGIREENESSITIFALCLKTSSLQDKPHEVSAIVQRKKQDAPTSFVLSCTCIAGKSKRCKHCIALLLHMNSKKAGDLEDLSCTDIQQEWGRLKKSTKECYNPARVKDLCHVKPSKNKCRQFKVSELQQEEMRNALIVAAPNSAIALHIKGRTAKVLEPKILRTIITPSAVNNQETFNCMLAVKGLDMDPLYYKCIRSDLSNCKITITNVCFKDLNSSLKDFYDKYVNLTIEHCTYISERTVAQSNSQEWTNLRKVRITASNCYKLYTFSGTEDQWFKKVESLMQNQFHGNNNTRFGIANEAQALERYIAVTSYSAKKFGLIINPLAPWLGFSPDAIVFVGQEAEILVEVKCLVAGMHTSIFELAAKGKIPYIKSEKENYQLRKKHAYYAQIQMGLALTNIKFAHLVIFSKIDNAVLIVNVEKDNEFIRQLFDKMKLVYFKYMLPTLLRKQNVKI